MTRRYRDQLLAALEDGDWHDAAELAHPYLPPFGLDAWIGILRAAGHMIEEDDEGTEARYRLVARASPPG